MGDASSRSWIAALRTACPSWVIRQRRERGIFATRPRCRLTRRENLRAARAIGGSAGPEQLHAYPAVPEALELVLPAEHGGEQGESGRAPSVPSGRFALGAGRACTRRGPGSRRTRQLLICDAGAGAW